MNMGYQRVSFGNALGAPQLQHCGAAVKGSARGNCGQPLFCFVLCFLLCYVSPHVWCCGYHSISSENSLNQELASNWPLFDSKTARGHRRRFFR